MIRRTIVLTGAALLATVTGVNGQSLHTQCADALPGYAAYCRTIADAAVTVPARVAVMATGGNPVAGTASTLGMRTPGSPRFSAALRGTMARARMPGVNEDGSGTMGFTGVSVALDAGLGVFHGVSLAPTVGGFGSLDVLASAGLLRVPEADGFRAASAFTWSLGARVGVLRESFTAPGVSVSAMYRGLPDVTFARPDADSDGFEVTSPSVLSVRAVVGKRVLGVGLVGGIGWDRSKSDLTASYAVMSPGGSLPPVTIMGSATDSRMSYFGSIAHTVSILNLVAELGWQQDGDRPAGAHERTRSGGLFGGLIVRVTL